MSHLCFFVRQKKPYTLKKALLLSITSSLFWVVKNFFYILKNQIFDFNTFYYLQTIYPTRNKIILFFFFFAFHPSSFITEEGSLKISPLNILDFLGFKKLRTTSSHSQTNDLTKEMNQTLFTVLPVLPGRFNPLYKDHSNK